MCQSAVCFQPKMGFSLYYNGSKSEEAAILRDVNIHMKEQIINVNLYGN